MRIWPLILTALAPIYLATGLFWHGLDTLGILAMLVAAGGCLWGRHRLFQLLSRSITPSRLLEMVRWLRRLHLVFWSDLILTATLVLGLAISGAYLQFCWIFPVLFMAIHGVESWKVSVYGTLLG